MAVPPPRKPKRGRTGLEGRHAMRAPNLPVLFHPDCNRRLRNCTESADPADCSVGARALKRSLAITAGGDFHPAPRTRSDRNPTDAINAPLAKQCNDFLPARRHYRARGTHLLNCCWLSHLQVRIRKMTPRRNRDADNEQC